MSAAMISASPPSDVDDLTRGGNQAIEREDYANALHLYQQAEEGSPDPGLIAFNKATAYYQLQDYRRAESHYRMALDDQAISEERRAKALYNVGDCLVLQANDSDFQRLRQAIRFFEMCLEMEPGEGLRQDAAHNLELAKLLWNKARSKVANPPAPNADEPPDDARSPDTRKKEEEMPKEEPNDGADATAKNERDPRKLDFDPKSNDMKGKFDPNDQKKKMDSAIPRDAGPPVLADTDQFQRRSAEDTLKTLEEVEKRLHNERRRLRLDAAVPASPNGRDW